VRDGRLQLLIIIPPDYEENHLIYTETFNVNSDMMKNNRLRLEHSILDNLNKNGNIKIIPVLITEKANDVWRAAFISGSCFLIALFFGACISAANLFAFDLENRTKKEVLLTPVSLTATGFGIILSSVVITLFTSLPSLLFAVYIFKMQIYALNTILLFAAMIPVMIGCAGLGILIAHYTKNYRVFQPVIIVVSMATFFVAGGYAGVAVLPDAAQAFAKVWAFSYIFEVFNPILHNFKSTLTLSQLLGILFTAVSGLSVIPFIYRRELRISISSGQ
jgi:hypothetical protein